LEELKALEAEEPDVATLSLLMANAALLADNPAEASKRISDSISKRESVSDALTLQAIIEAKLASDSDYKKMGSPKVRIEQLLRQAIAADSSNARPYFELATLKRFEQKNEEALELLRSAQCRLSAADSRVITDTAIALTTLQTLPDAELKPAENPRPVPDEIFAAAYVAMRLGDFARAASILETAKSLFPEPIFRQILKDPAFLPYLKEPALTDFFKPSEQTEKK
jgi:tetratricopeptide (TPR) repeat protein